MNMKRICIVTSLLFCGLLIVHSKFLYYHKSCIQRRNRYYEFNMRSSGMIYLNYIHVCNSVIVTPNWFLSLASCFYREDKNLTVFNIIIRIGEKVIQFYIEDIFFYPKFVKGSNRFNLVLIKGKLSQRADKIHPVQLHDPKWTFTSTQCATFGYCLFCKHDQLIYNAPFIDWDYNCEESFKNKKNKSTCSCKDPQKCFIGNRKSAIKKHRYNIPICRMDCFRLNDPLATKRHYRVPKILEKGLKLIAGEVYCLKGGQLDDTFIYVGSPVFCSPVTNTFHGLVLRKIKTDVPGEYNLLFIKLASSDVIEWINYIIMEIDFPNIQIYD